MSETPVLILILGILTESLRDVYCKFSHFKLRDKSVDIKSFFPKCQTLELQIIIIMFKETKNLAVYKKIKIFYLPKFYFLVFILSFFHELSYYCGLLR